MRLIKESIFKLTKDFDAICLATNNVNSLLQSDLSDNLITAPIEQPKVITESFERWPGLQEDYNINKLNVPIYLGAIDQNGFLLTKPFVENGYYCRIFTMPSYINNIFSVSLLKQSCHYISAMINKLELEYVGVEKLAEQDKLGAVDWDKEVKSVMAKILDDKFYIAAGNV